MTAKTFRKRLLESSSALQALTLLGAGVAMSAVAVAPAHAQDYTNVNATGRVISTDGSPISGATVTVTSNEQGFTRTTTTDTSGGYRIGQLPTGSYTFTISADGFEDFTDAAVSLEQASSANQFALAPISAGGEIVVTAGRTEVVDFERTTTGAVIPIGELQTRVPVSRSLRDVVLLAPGTTQGSSSGNATFANQAQISGSSFTENAYYINGLNITEFRQGFSPVTVPFDFYDTVEVKTGGFQAEFGRATGGVVNAITKSGSNDLKGSVLFNWEPDSLSSDVPNTFEFDNDGAFSERMDMVATLSGPIIEDRLFVFGLYNSRFVESGRGRRTAATAAGNTATTATTSSPFWAVKVDAVPIDGQRLEFTYFDSSGVQLNKTYQYNSDTNAYGRVTGTSRTRYGGTNYVGRYTGSFTDWLTLSAAYGVNNNRAGTLPAIIDQPRVIDQRSGSLVPLPGTNPSSSFTTNDDKRTFYRADADLYFNAFGSHHIRFGYDREDLEAVQVATPTGGGLYNIFTVTSTTDRSNLPIGSQYFSRRYFENGGAFKSKNDAFYIQDNWQLFQNRLSLQAGIRLDRFTAKADDGQTFFESGDLWGPRLGFSFDVLGDGSAKLFGSYGKTYVPVVSNTNVRLAGSELDYTNYNIFAGLDANGVPIAGAPVLTVNNAAACPDTGIANCTITSLGGSGSIVESMVSRNAKAQYLDEFILGAEYRVPDSRWRFGIEGMWRKLGVGLEDAAIDQAALAYCTGRGFSQASCDALYSGFSQYVLINPGFDQTIVLSSHNNGPGLPDGTNPTVNFTAAQLGYPKVERDYYAVTLKADREFDGIWSASASYTWSDLKGNYEGGAKSDIGQADTGITQDFDQPGFTVGSYGFLPGHRRHTFKLYGSYALTDWFTVGANALVQSPKKFGCLGVVPTAVDPFAELYGAGGFFCQGVLTPRASKLESDWRKEINMSFLLKMPVDFDASLRLDVFNILNSKSVTELWEYGDLDSGSVDPNYGKPYGYQAPRSARVQLRVGF